MQMLKDFFLMLSDFIVKNPLIWICCLASFVLSSVFIPIIIKLCKKHGWYDSVNARKVHKGNIPRLGSMGFVQRSSSRGGSTRKPRRIEGEMVWEKVFR